LAFSFWLSAGIKTGEIVNLFPLFSHNDFKLGKLANCPANLCTFSFAKFKKSKKPNVKCQKLKAKRPCTFLLIFLLNMSIID